MSADRENPSTKFRELKSYLWIDRCPFGDRAVLHPTRAINPVAKSIRLAGSGTGEGELGRASKITSDTTKFPFEGIRPGPFAGPGSDGSENVPRNMPVMGDSELIDVAMVYTAVSGLAPPASNSPGDFGVNVVRGSVEELLRMLKGVFELARSLSE